MAIKSSSKRKPSTSQCWSMKKRASLAQKPCFPINKIHEYLEQILPGKLVKPEVAIFLVGVMEHVARELIQSSYNVSNSQPQTSNSDAVVTTSSDIDTAVRSDPEFKELMEKVLGAGKLL